MEFNPAEYLQEADERLKESNNNFSAFNPAEYLKESNKNVTFYFLKTFLWNPIFNKLFPSTNRVFVISVNLQGSYYSTSSFSAFKSKSPSTPIISFQYSA